MAAAGFIHQVYFWLKEAGDTAAAESLAAGALHHLSGIPGVLRISVGFPAGTDRDLVDNSYGVGLLIEFADAAAQDLYQVHPDHLRFAAECSKYWSRVQVYDTLVIGA